MNEDYEFETQFRTKPVRVEAMEWRRERLDFGRRGFMMPYWFDGAVGYNKATPDLKGKIKIVGDNLQVVTDAGTAIAKPGDWIVFWTIDRHFSVHTLTDFEQRFEPDIRRKNRIRSTNEQPRSRKAQSHEG